jgi:hypothetical protein
MIPAMTSKPTRTGMIMAAGETLLDFFDVSGKFERLVVGPVVLGPIVLGPS